MLKLNGVTYRQGGGGLFSGAFSCSYNTACIVCEWNVSTEHRRALVDWWTGEPMYFWGTPVTCRGAAGPPQIPHSLAWDRTQLHLRWTEWHLDIFFSEYCRFPLSKSFHQCCMLIGLMYFYNKSQQDAPFLKLIFDNELCMFRTELLSIIRSLNTVYAVIHICHASYASRQSTELAWQIPIAAYAVLRLLMMDSRSVRNM